MQQSKWRQPQLPQLLDEMEALAMEALKTGYFYNPFDRNVPKDTNNAGKSFAQFIANTQLVQPHLPAELKCIHYQCFVVWVQAWIN